MLVSLAAPLLAAAADEAVAPAPRRRLKLRSPNPTPRELPRGP